MIFKYGLEDSSYLLYMKKDIAKWINITDKELDRDIINLSLPQADITPGELDCYGPEMEEWLQNGMKGKPSDYVKDEN